VPSARSIDLPRDLAAAGALGQYRLVRIDSTVAREAKRGRFSFQAVPGTLQSRRSSRARRGGCGSAPFTRQPEQRRVNGGHIGVCSKRHSRGERTRIGHSHTSDEDPQQPWNNPKSQVTWACLPAIHARHSPGFLNLHSGSAVPLVAELPVPAAPVISVLLAAELPVLMEAEFSVLAAELPVLMEAELLSKM